MSAQVRVPQIKSVETAVRLFYERVELSTADIQILFGCSQPTATKLKAAAKQKMDQECVPCWNARHVNTETAYAAWGIDIDSLEKRLRRLRQLKMSEQLGR